MKYHIMIALGILLGIVFSMRLAVQLLEPGLGTAELYLLGGVAISSCLIFFGLRERRFARQNDNGLDS